MLQQPAPCIGCEHHCPWLTARTQMRWFRATPWKRSVVVKRLTPIQGLPVKTEEIRPVSRKAQLQKGGYRKTIRSLLNCNGAPRWGIFAEEVLEPLKSPRTKTMIPDWIIPICTCIYIYIYPYIIYIYIHIPTYIYTHTAKSPQSLLGGPGDLVSRLQVML